jgi:ABC-2 type transport system ATP-binding protein
MIETRGLRKQFGSIVALHQLDLKVERGTIFGYVGPNGAGKTTTIRILCGLMTPSAGSAEIGGVDVVQNPSHVRAMVGYMPDYLTPYEGMRVWEYLDFFGAAYRIGRKERRVRVGAVLDLAGAEAMRDYYVETLSHGMRQRLGVARALIHDPALLILDEPTNGLDPRARVEMRLLLGRLRETGKTILISSHILPELASICDSVGFMEQGKLVACGSVRDVQRKVHPHRVFEIDVLSDPAPVEQALRQLIPQEKLFGLERIENLLRLQMEANDEEVAQALKQLVLQGHSIMGFREVITDLEEVFIALTTSGQFGRRSTENTTTHH